MSSWIQQGKLAYKEHVVDGFENIPNVLVGLFKGDNLGKAIVKV
jgi:NADPH-dependent curcumin reductase CurA